MYTQAWREGFRGGRLLPPSQSPYDSGTLQAWSWYRGFTEGVAQRMGRRYSDMPVEPVEWPALPSHTWYCSNAHRL